MKRSLFAYLLAAVVFIATAGYLAGHNAGCGVLVPPDVSGQSPAATAAEIKKWEGMVAFYQDRVDVLRAALATPNPGADTNRIQKDLDKASYLLNWAQGLLKVLAPPTTQPAL